jgi:hypothetical protein
MSLLQKIKNNSLRLFVFLVILFLIFQGSHTLFLFVVFAALLYYTSYYESLGFGILYDVFFSLEKSRFLGIPFFYTLIFLMLLVSVSFIRSLLLRP